MQEVYELSHDGDKFIAEEVLRHETGPSAVMNCSTYSNNKRSCLAAGQESYCQLYDVQSILVTEEDHIETIGENNVRQRKVQSKTPVDNNKNSKKLKFAIKPGDSVKTDFDGDDPLLRVVRICNVRSIMATGLKFQLCMLKTIVILCKYNCISGGTDGLVKLWKFPSLQPLHTLKAHSKEIDDLDFSRYENYLVSIAKDGIAVLWDYAKGKEINRLTWKQPEGSKYLYKRCRYKFLPLSS